MTLRLPFSWTNSLLSRYWGSHGQHAHSMSKQDLDRQVGVVWSRSRLDAGEEYVGVSELAHSPS